MKEEWLLNGAVVPVTCETVTELVLEIKRLIDVVGGMALAQPEQPAQREWAGLTDGEVELYWDWDWEDFQCGAGRLTILNMVRDIEAKLKEKNT